MPSLKLLPLALAAALCAQAVLAQPAGQQPPPLIVRQDTVAPLYRIADIGPGGIAVIDRNNVLWMTSRDNQCRPGGTLVPYIANASSTTIDMDANGWSRIANNAAEADLGLISRRTPCGYVIGSHLRTLDNRYLVSGQYTNGACVAGGTPIASYTYTTWVQRGTNAAKMFPEYLHYVYTLGTDGSVWSAGFNGSGERASSSMATGCASVSYAQRVGTNFVKTVRVGNGTTVGIKADGTLWGVGLNNTGQYGWLTTATYVPPSTGVSTIGGAAFAAAPGTAGLAKDYFFGSTNLSATMPTQLLLRPNGDLDVSVDRAVTYTRLHTGVARIFYPYYFPVGTLPLLVLETSGNLVEISGPTRVKTTLTGNVADVKYDAHGNVLVLKKDGTVWAKGPNASGQFGNGTTTAIASLTQIASNVVEIAMGTNMAVTPYLSTTALLKADGSLWIAGYTGSADLSWGRISAFTTSVMPMTNLTRFAQIPTPGNLASASGTP